MLLVGLVLAVALPKASITSVEIVDGSTIKAAFRGAASATIAARSTSAGATPPGATKATSSARSSPGAGFFFEERSE